MCEVRCHMKESEKNFHHFIKQLILSEGIKRVSTFAIITGLSRRMIYYYLDELNYYLKNHNVSAYIQGETLTTQQKHLCQQFLNSGEKSEQNRLFSVDERKVIMLYHILFETQRITIGFFEQLFLLSKNTVLKDMVVLRELLEELDVELHVNKKRGYYLEVDEFRQRQLTYIFFHILSTPKYSAISPYIITLIRDKQILWTTQNVEKIITLIHNTSSILLKNIAEDDALILAQTLLSLELRASLVDQITIPEKFEMIVSKRIEFEAATIFAENFSLLTGRSMAHAEKILFGMYLLCVEKDIDQHYLAPNFKNHYDISCQFIQLFQLKYGITFYQSELILKNVQTYIKVAYYRSILQMNIPNKSYRIVLSRYPKVFQIIQRLVIDVSQTIPIFNVFFPHGFSPDMMSDLTVIFEDAILREQTRSYNLQAIIVSNSSKVERSLVQSHITQHLPMIKVLNSLSSKSGQKFTHSIDLCITTVDEYEHHFGKTIHIHSIPTEKDIEKIQQFQYEHFHLRKRRAKIRHLLEELNKTNDIEKTLNEIEHVYIGLNKTRTHRTEYTLLDYQQDRKHVYNCKSKTTLSIIVQKSCAKFIQRNTATIQYQNELLKNVEKKIVYQCNNVIIVCGDYRKGALSTDIQINKLKQPIIFNNTEINEVYVLVSSENMHQVPLIFAIEDNIKNV